MTSETSTERPADMTSSPIADVPRHIYKLRVDKPGSSFHHMYLKFARDRTNFPYKRMRIGGTADAWEFQIYEGKEKNTYVLTTSGSDPIAEYAGLVGQSGLKVITCDTDRHRDEWDWDAWTISPAPWTPLPDSTKRYLTYQDGDEWKWILRLDGSDSPLVERWDGSRTIQNFEIIKIEVI